MGPKTTFNIWYVVIAIIGVLLLQQWFAQMQQVEQIPYSQFEDLLKAGEIKDIYITQNQIEGEFTKPLPDGRTKFATTRVDPAFAEQLEKYNVRYSGVVQSTFLRDLLSWILPVILFFGLWMFVFRGFADKQGMGGLMSIGKSKAKLYMEKDTKVTFEDVAGVDEAKAELEEVVAFLRDPGTYGRLGARMPKGILLVGPPGCGKTLFARAIAGEAGVPFISTNGAEFVEMFVGVGAARVRDLFETARKSAPCIIFIDELDALGRARGIGPMTGGHDEREMTLNQLLVELDGFDPSQGVVLLAATNRPEILDPALLRAGRFDRQVLVDRPDRKGRVQILNVHMKKVQLGPDVDADKVAALTPGFTGADLANLVNEAALVATRRKADRLEMADFTAAVERIVAGLEKKSRVLSPKEREVVAFHEMGHALVAKALPGGDEVHKVSIIPRGIGALGYTIQRPTEDRFLMTRPELERKMSVLLGGRAAETLIFEELSTGASDDLAKVTDIARAMVTRFGMVESLGQVTYEGEVQPFLGEIAMPWRPRQYSEDTAREIDLAVRKLVDHSFEDAQAILAANRAMLERAARLLLARETLAEDDLQAFQPVLPEGRQTPRARAP